MIVIFSSKSKRCAKIHPYTRGHLLSTGSFVFIFFAFVNMFIMSSLTLVTIYNSVFMYQVLRDVCYCFSSLNYKDQPCTMYYNKHTCYAVFLLGLNMGPLSHAVPRPNIQYQTFVNTNKLVCFSSCPKTNIVNLCCYQAYLFPFCYSTDI